MSAGADQSVRVLLCFPEDPDLALVAQIKAAGPGVDVVVAGYDEPHEVRTARGSGQDHRGGQVSDELRAALATAEVVLALDLPSGIAELAPRMRWLQTVGAGVDHFQRRGIPAEVTVTNAAGVAAVSIAEFVIARVLGVWKRTHELDAGQRRHEWEPTYGRRLAGCTMLVVGLGAIGSAVAERAAALGMEVLGVRRSPAPHPSCREVRGPDELATLLGRADVVVLSAPATTETANLFDAAAFAAMRPGAVFCNVARGTLVDEDALVEALDSGQLGAAILDVTRQEPLPKDSSLWDAPNLFLSPHSSSAPQNYAADVVELFADNLARWLTEQPMRNVVDLERGY